MRDLRIWAIEVLLDYAVRLGHNRSEQARVRGFLRLDSPRGEEDEAIHPVHLFSREDGPEEVAYLPRWLEEQCER